ncbi:MAG: HEAT repeat domain-containing protein [Opitutaceae bacterium]
MSPRFGFRFFTARCLLALLTAVGAALSAEVGPHPRTLEQALIETLERSTDVVRRCDACRQLIDIGTPACIPALVAALSQERVSHAASNTLAKLPFPEVDSALRGALPQVTGAARIGLVDLLGIRRDGAAVEPLSPLLASADPALTEAASRALGRIGSDGALAALESQPRPFVPGVAHALLACAEIRREAGRTPEAARLYRLLMVDDSPEPIRSAAWMGLARTETSQRTELITQAFFGAQGPIRDTAFQLLRERPDRTLLAAFLGRWNELAAVQRLAVMDAHVAFGAEAVPTLRLAAKDADPGVRRAALASMSKTGDPSLVPLLLEAAAAGEMPERESARYSLARLTGPGVAEALESALERTPVPQTNEGLRALGERAEPRAAALLLRFAVNEDATVAYAAQRALVQLNDPATLAPVLDLAVARTADSVRRPLVQVAANLCADAPDKVEANRLVFAALRRIPIADRTAWFDLLPALSTTEASAEAELHALGPDPDSARAAVLAFARWHDASPTPILIRLARRDPSAPLSRLALRSAITLTDREPSGEQRLILLESIAPWAQSPEEKVLLLTQLRRIRTPAAARLVATFLVDQDVAERAAADLTDLLEVQHEAARQLAATLLPEVVKISKSPETLERAALLQEKTKSGPNGGARP